MGLREKLRDRLMRLHDKLEKPFDVPGGIMTRSRNEVWGAIADECIRQMEWARHECPFEWAGVPDPVTRAGSRDAILSAAPEGWKPGDVLD